MSLRTVAHLLAALLPLAALAAALGLPVGQPALAAAPARVALLHAAPLAGEGAATIAIDGPATDLVRSLSYGNALPYIDVPPGETVFRLYQGALSAPALPGATPALTTTLSLAAGKDYTLIVAGGANGRSLELLLLPNDAQRPASSTGKLRFIHAAPLAAGRDATAVDIVTEGGQAVPGLLNIGYGETSGYLSLPSGVAYDLKAVPSGSPGGPTLLDLPPLTLAPGQVLTLVAIGGANGRGPALVALELEERRPARLRVVHAAPSVAALGQLTVTLDGQAHWGAVAFGKMTADRAVDEGSYTLRVTAPGDPPALLAVENVELRRDLEYVALLRPGADGQGLVLTLEQLGPSITPRKGQGLLMVYHLAPFDTGGRSALDVRDHGGELVDAGLAGLRFGEQRVVALPAREYDLRLTTPGGGEQMEDLAPFTVMEGEVATIFVVGGADGRPGGSIVLAPPVQQRFFLPMVGR